jgi:FkbM family methyltransferase
MMTSYAQNFEDVLLARALASRRRGFYIDVGAWDPIRDSVTKHFYDLGWNGINIEPVESYFRLLEEDRPRDINLRVALGDEAGFITLYNVADTGLSTMVKEFAANAQGRGYTTSEEIVPIMTLRQICDEYVDSEIDFLKIDVEGWERQVIRGGDWEKYRPRIVVVEATEPSSPKTNFANWEGDLLDIGYLFAFFDGLNRFYVRPEDRELLEALAVPANLFDHFQIASHLKAEQQISALRQECDKLARERDRLAALLSEIAGERDALKPGAAEYFRQLKDVTSDRGHLRAQLELILSSRTWRYSRLFRESWAALKGRWRR